MGNSVYTWWLTAGQQPMKLWNILQHLMCYRRWIIIDSKFEKKIVSRSWLEFFFRNLLPFVKIIRVRYENETCIKLLCKLLCKIKTFSTFGLGRVRAHTLASHGKVDNSECHNTWEACCRSGIWLWWREARLITAVPACDVSWQLLCN